MAVPVIRDAPVWCDLGCGNGIAAAAALGEPFGGRAVLVDVAEDALRQAEREIEAARTVTLLADLDRRSRAAAGPRRAPRRRRRRWMHHVLRGRRAPGQLRPAGGDARGARGAPRLHGGAQRPQRRLLVDREPVPPHDVGRGGLRGAAAAAAGGSRGRRASSRCSGSVTLVDGEDSEPARDRLRVPGAARRPPTSWWASGRVRRGWPAPRRSARPTWSSGAGGSASARATSPTSSHRGQGQGARERRARGSTTGGRTSTSSRAAWDSRCRAPAATTRRDSEPRTTRRASARADAWAETGSRRSRRSPARARCPLRPDPELARTGAAQGCRARPALPAGQRRALHDPRAGRGARRPRPRVLALARGPAPARRPSRGGALTSGCATTSDRSGPRCTAGSRPGRAPTSSWPPAGRRSRGRSSSPTAAPAPTSCRTTSRTSSPPRRRRAGRSRPTRRDSST